MDDIFLGRRIEARMADLGLSNNDVAIRMGISAGRLSSIKAQVRATPQMIRRLAAALETTPAFFYGLDASVQTHSVPRNGNGC
ncbi:MAG: helix-turn-helix domain-containing protein [Proteobacteria bacterium]|nr:helix-turn-helix domain-containing protein [Pseudomonadota bacterium]MBU1740736.1 helix-turn-helix domain-containing protein [Pseudomonadota bacterium]